MSHAEVVDPPTSGKIPPRVRGIPVLGNSLQLAGDPDAFFVDAYRRFGPIFKVNVFFRDYTVLAGREAFAFFMKEKERYFSRESFYDAFARELGTEQFILGQPAHLHQHLRGQMRLAYSRQVAAEFIPRMIQTTDAALDAQPPGSSIITMDFVAKVAFSQYGWVMAGRSLDEHYEDVALYTNRIMNVGAKIWPEFSLKSPKYKRAHAHVFALLADLVRECRERPADSGVPFTVMDAMLAAKTDEGGPMDLADQVACVVYGFIGTIIYMNRAMSFLLYDLLTNPEMLDRVTHEVDSIFAKDAPSSLDLRGMTLLRAALKESMRLHPIALALPFIAEEDFEFQGHVVRRKEYCVVSGVPGHFSEEFYKCPHMFDPDRCLPPRNEHKPKGAHVPFGFSIRTCPALGLVETIALITVSRMIHRRELAVAPAGYRLQTRLDPLPGPSRNFRIVLGDARRAPPPQDDASWKLAANAIEELSAGEKLRDPLLQARLEGAHPRHFAAGQLIIREGDAADAFYILLEGDVEVSKGAAEKPLGVLHSGTYFGERGIIGEGRRTANCRARTDVLVLEMGADDFHGIVREFDLVPGEIAGAARRMYLSAQIRAALPHVDAPALSGVLSGCHLESRAAGARIIVQGDEADTFYIILEGQVRVQTDSAHGSRALAVLGAGDFFGEIGILDSKPRMASVNVTEDGPAELLAVPRATLLEVVGRSPSARADIVSVMAARLVRALSG